MQSALSHEFSTANRTNPEFENALSCEPSFQQLSASEKEVLKEKLDDDLRNIKLLFGCLVTKTQNSVEGRIPVATFATSILALSAFEPAPDSEIGHFSMNTVKKS